MKKLIVPALVIAAIGGYLYYVNLETTAPETAIATEVDAAVAEAEAAGAEATPPAEGVMAAAEGDIFADVPEAMDTAAAEAGDAMEAVADTASEAMDEVAEAAEEIDHADE
ncbi:hypothetical protein ACNKU7_04780 [Microbulbifer sp. SA54]|uniref:hypothetical protein n=1 Tax=Microbulbifer sp. SA54 TaxID=3401577 RepID=UPI003AAC7CB6